VRWQENSSFAAFDCVMALLFAWLLAVKVLAFGGFFLVCGVMF
jgi:hypothetical protein